jgi:hypothetical protein
VTRHGPRPRHVVALSWRPSRPRRPSGSTAPFDIIVSTLCRDFAAQWSPNSIPPTGQYASNTDPAGRHRKRPATHGQFRNPHNHPTADPGFVLRRLSYAYGVRNSETLHENGMEAFGRGARNTAIRSARRWAEVDGDTDGRRGQTEFAAPVPYLLAGSRVALLSQDLSPPRSIPVRYQSVAGQNLSRSDRVVDLARGEMDSPISYSPQTTLRLSFMAWPMAARR